MSEPTVLLTGRLESWQVSAGRILGKIYNDSKGRFEDGKVVITSTINEEGEELKEGSVVTTKNSTYVLGVGGGL